MYVNILTTLVVVLNHRDQWSIEHRQSDSVEGMQLQCSNISKLIILIC